MMDAETADYRFDTPSARECVRDHSSSFFQHVMSDIDYWQNSKVHGKHVPFAQFKLTNSDFYLFAHATAALEAMTRSDLVNPGLADLFETRGITALWPEPEGLRHLKTNASYEDEVPYEFIVESESGRTGYRYTDPTGSNEAIQEKMDRYNLDELVVIKWEDKPSDRRRYELEGNLNLKSEGSEKFFARYFRTEDYVEFVDTIKELIATAQELYQFSTVPKLSNRYLAQFKEEVSRELENTKNQDLEYIQSPTRKARPLSVNTADYKTMKKRLFDDELYRALLGEADFAKCFITAEYMFKNFDRGAKIDYTVIAAGYLKAVEQLEYALMKIALGRPCAERLWIKSEVYRIDTEIAPREDWRKISGRLHIAFKPEYEQYFDITQGPLSYFLRYDKYGWNVSHSTITSIFNSMDEFRAECRNGHFHKDNIDEYDEVSRIRHNALAVMFFLIGGYKINTCAEEALALLGASNERYLRFFHELRKNPYGARRFILQLQDGNTVTAQRCWTPVIPSYDDEGVPTTGILFTVLDGLENTSFEDPPEELYPERALIITRDNCPLKVWLGGSYKKKRII